MEWITSFLFGHAPDAYMAIAPLLLGGLLAGGGLLKSMTLDRAKEDRQRKLAAETARYSPWTGMTPGAIEEADPFGSALQFGTTGAMLGQGIQNQQFQSDLMAGANGGPVWKGISRGYYGPAGE